MAQVYFFWIWFLFSGFSNGRRHRERAAALRTLDLAAADALDADAHALDGAADLDLDVLQVGRKPPLAASGHLAANAAEVLGFAAVRILVAADRLFATDGTLHSHGP